MYKNNKVAGTDLATSALCPENPDKKLIFNRKRMTFEVYSAMLASFGLQDYNKKKLKVLVCGTGAGVFSMFLKAQLHAWLEKLTTVDTNESFVNLGKKYFGFVDGGNCESVIGDAHDFVKAA